MIAIAGQEVPIFSILQLTLFQIIQKHHENLKIVAILTELFHFVKSRSRSHVRSRSGLRSAPGQVQQVQGQRTWALH